MYCLCKSEIITPGLALLCLFTSNLLNSFRIPLSLKLKLYSDFKILLIFVDLCPLKCSWITAARILLGTAIITILAATLYPSSVYPVCLTFWIMVWLSKRWSPNLAVWFQWGAFEAFRAFFNYTLLQWSLPRIRSDWLRNNESDGWRKTKTWARNNLTKFPLAGLFSVWIKLCAFRSCLSNLHVCFRSCVWIHHACAYGSGILSEKRAPLRGKEMMYYM